MTCFGDYTAMQVTSASCDHHAIQTTRHAHSTLCNNSALCKNDKLVALLHDHSSTSWNVSEKLISDVNFSGSFPTPNPSRISALSSQEVGTSATSPCLFLTSFVFSFDSSSSCGIRIFECADVMPYLRLCRCSRMSTSMVRIAAKW